MNVDDWIPNWDLFVLTLLPVLILVFFLSILLYRGLVYMKWRKWQRENPDPASQRSIDMVRVLTFVPYVYLIFPIFRIWDYLLGDITFLELVDGLFTVDFRGFMMVALIVFIIVAMAHLVEKGREMKARSQGVKT